MADRSDRAKPDESAEAALLLRFLEGQTTPEETATVKARLAASEDARREYVELCRQRALLHELFKTEAVPAVEPSPKGAPAKPRSTRWRWRGAFLALAASLIAVVGFFWFNARPSPPLSVAVITGVENCQWADPDAAPNPGCTLPAGSRLELSQGLAEISFVSGAKLVLRGPACLTLDSPNSGSLLSGAVAAKVSDPGANGFVLRTPHATVTDRGTEFGVEVDTDGQSRVATFSGMVEVSGRSKGGSAPVQVTAGNELRLSPSGEIIGMEANGGGFVRALPTAAIGLVAHWPLINDRLDDAVQPVGVTRLQGGTPQWNSAAPGSSDQVLSLSQQRHLFITHTRKLDLTGDVTIAAWIRTVEPVGDVVSKYDWIGNQRSYVLGVGGQREKGRKPGHVYAWFSGKVEKFSGVTLEGSRPVNDGQWHHIAVAFRAGKSITLFVDGKRDERAVVDGKVPSRLAVSPRQLVIGAGYRDSKQPNDYWFQGDLADIRIYRLALEDVTELMKGSRPGGSRHQR